ncbi:MAG: glycoside hydrolase family 3 C-terminal domain-containing protein [Chloroflexi bacterium]|nr:glycoside hydrolase family 3 C-terminal domain-containing protein [Chloroflexota bacterium]
MDQMTLDEKVAQLGSVWSFEVADGEAVAGTLASEHLAQGIGQITRPGGATNLEPRGVARLANAIQRYLVEETRLGIPAILHEECLHGLMSRGSTCYPQAIGQAATWDPELIGRMARAIASRLRAVGSSQGLSPILDVARDPRWGRIEETFGEDPYLIAELGSAYITALQEVGPDERPVIATVKHLVGHGLPEGGFNQGPAHIGARELVDDYLYPFEVAVRVSGAASVMHAYDDLDGVPCVASRELLTTILRDQWGFDGIVVADYAGVDQLVHRHELAADLGAAAQLALEAGLDMELPRTAAFGPPLRAAIEDGRVAVDLVDQAVERVLTAKVRLGLFEQPYVDERLADAPDDDERALAAEIGRRSMVLLQNTGDVLPLPSDLRTIAVIGPNAHDARALMGDYAHIAHIETLLERDGRNGVGADRSPLHLELLDELAGVPTVLDVLRERLPDTEVRYARGTGLQDGTDADIADAVAAARGADIAVVVLGERSGLTPDCTCGEARDRWDLGLLGRQSELLTAVAATGTPVVLVLLAGRPQAIETEAERCAAIVQAWLPGDLGASAIVDVLLGVTSPGGKLPVTIPRHVGQVPLYHGHRPSGGRSTWRERYVDGSNLPMWPFGFGLSYSRFRIDDLSVDSSEIGTHDTVTVSVRVTNVGEVAADEVVQLYIRGLDGSVTRPVRQLRGFRRVHLAPGTAQRVTFRLHAELFSFAGLDHRVSVEPGRQRIMVGSSSADIACTSEIRITGSRRVLDGPRVLLAEVSAASTPA